MVSFYWGIEVGSGAECLKKFYNHPFRLRETTVFSITIHPVIDMIDCLFYDIMTGKKVGGGAEACVCKFSLWLLFNTIAEGTQCDAYSQI